MKTIKDYYGLLNKHLPQALVKACYESILHNDPAHNVDHIYAVCKYGLELLREEKDNIKISMIMSGCLMHDLGCRYDRDNHHRISYGLSFKFLEEYATGVFDPDEIILIANSCLEHRASWKEARTDEISDYVALADRGKPNLEDMIYRCYLYRKAETPKKSLDDVKEEIFEHLKEKCSSDGYMWKSYPDFGWKINGDMISGIINIVGDNKLLCDVIDRVVTREENK